MQVTEVRIKLVSHDDPSERLRGFASVTFEDAFVLKDIKILCGNQGDLFVAMPSKKKGDHCPLCSLKNALDARFCSQCGYELDPRRGRDDNGERVLHCDIFHPINTQARDWLMGEVLTAYRAELAKCTDTRS